MSKEINVTKITIHADEIEPMEIDNDVIKNMQASAEYAAEIFKFLQPVIDSAQKTLLEAYHGIIRDNYELRDRIDSYADGNHAKSLEYQRQDVELSREANAANQLFHDTLLGLLEIQNQKLNQISSNIARSGN